MFLIAPKMFVKPPKWYSEPKIWSSNPKKPKKIFGLLLAKNGTQKNAFFKKWYSFFIYLINDQSSCDAYRQLPLP